MQRAYKASEALFQRDDRRRHLVLEECVPAARIDCFYSRRHYGIRRDCERQAVNNDAAELLALDVYSLPERRCCEQHAMGRGAKFLEQRALRGIALKKHRELDLPEQALVDVTHLGVAGEQNERTAARDLQKPANAFCGLWAKLGGARVRQIRRYVKQ